MTFLKEHIERDKGCNYCIKRVRCRWLTVIPTKKNARQKVKILFICSSLFFILIICSGCSKNKYPIDTPYEFTCIPGSDEWEANSSVAERKAKNKVPDDTVKKMTATALVQTYLDYPYSIDILLFSDESLGYEAVKAENNVLQELETRDDAFKALYDKYLSLGNDDMQKFILRTIMLSGNFVMTEEDIKNRNAAKNDSFIQN